MMHTARIQEAASRLLAAAGFACMVLTAAPAASEPITVTFKDALAGGANPLTLPVTLDGTEHDVFLRFNVPDFNRIISVNSIDVRVALHDDGDARDEGGAVLFALRQPDPDLFLDCFCNELQGTTSGSPFTFNYSLDPFEINAVLPTLTDNPAFRIRVVRDFGDFVVVSGSVAIDAVLRPIASPGTLACLALGLSCLVWASRRRLVPVAANETRRPA